MAKKLMKPIIFIVLLTISTFGFSNNQWVYDDRGCRTPDRGVGNCVIVQECKSILDFLRETPAITPEVSRFLRNYVCGYQGNLTKVCCPNISINFRQNTERTPVPVTPTTHLPPDVSNHKNLHLLPSVEECGPFSLRDRIINGNKTALYEFPWMALLSYQTRTGPSFRCGGTLINDRYILTAAHCITNLSSLTLLGVRLGEHNITSESDCELESRNNYVCAEKVQDIFIEAIIPHPNFNNITLSNDIGLLRLRTPAQLKESVQPICLPTGEIVKHKNFTNAKLLVTGWGFTGPGSTGSDVLLKVEVPVMAETTCKSVYANQTSAIVDYKHLCAGGINMKDSCGGDSGGPLQMIEIFDGDIHFVQYGIVSFGHRNCGQEGFPGVYTRIDHYMDWILDNIKWAYDDEGCRTPDRGVGNCVIIKECKRMVEFLERAPTITPEMIRFLRNYQCGFQGKFVKVCCPDTPIKGPPGSNIVTPPVVTPSIPTTPSPPDVSNHRNINLLPSVDSCGPFPTRNRIINGNKTALYEFPWMALLSYQTRSGPDFRCGGTLINNRYILTAAHCITHLDNLTLLGVRLGEYNITSEPDCELEGKNNLVCADRTQDIFIEDIIPHPRYNFTTYTNDIGLLRLRTPAVLKESVQPICLPTGENLRQKNFTNAKLIVTGWGATGSRTRRSDDLLKVEIPIIPESECKAVYNQTPAVINHRQLCAGGKNRRDSCGGDSGGPLQTVETFDGDVQFVQYGVVSFGPRNCGQEGFPGVYTRIDYYMDWILDNMRA